MARFASYLSQGSTRCIWWKWCCIEGKGGGGGGERIEGGEGSGRGCRKRVRSCVVLYMDEWVSGEKEKTFGVRPVYMDITILYL